MFVVTPGNLGVCLAISRPCCHSVVVVFSVCPASSRCPSHPVRLDRRLPTPESADLLVSLELMTRLLTAVCPPLHPVISAPEAFPPSLPIRPGFREAHLRIIERARRLLLHLICPIVSLSRPASSTFFCRPVLMDVSFRGFDRFSSPATPRPEIPSHLLSRT